MYIYVYTIYLEPPVRHQISAPKRSVLVGPKGPQISRPWESFRYCVYIYIYDIHTCIYNNILHTYIYIDICIQTSIKLMQRSDSIRRIPWFFWQERIRKLMLHFITWPPKRRCTFVGRTLSVMEVSCQSPAAWQLKKSYHETVAGFHRTCPGAFFRWNWRCPL